ncbi:serine O-acetyltransferase [Cellulomonas composti]|uniref:Serine acetyltransferase n=1 Tax=Cellulomonas composti TaxID=266130 RepID=A0A511JAG3_9CELL|nr:serine acetyltransferase [Cellulomonas composti]GEL94982.1 hypothetical protein CCO02nite_16400 [Cellulomonas composti]
MLPRIWVKAYGGWWAHRQVTVRARGPRRRIEASVHKLYLEGFGGYISLLATFDGAPTFPHKPMGVFIAPGAVVGKRVTIYQQVTLGKNDTETSPRFGSPTIGDDVYIGAGAKIIGAVTIGARSRIGAGAVVVQDVPADSTVVAAPVRTIARPAAG